MASAKLSALPSLAGAQVPADLAYVVQVSAGAAGSKSSTLNNLFSIVTKNITDGALRFQGFAAPSVSAAGQGAIYFDSTANRFLFSENAGAYVRIGNVIGPASATDNAITRFDGTTGRLIQNSLITVDDTGVVSGAIIGAGNTLGTVTMGLGSDATGDIYYRDAGGLLTRRAIGSASQILTVSGGLPVWATAPSTTPGGSPGQVQFNNASAFGGISGFTSDGTNVIAGSGNLRATLPQITTGIRDANANLIIGLSPVASSVDQFTIANAAAGGTPILSTTGTDTDIPAIISPKGAGRLESTGPLRLSGSGTDTYTTPQGNSVPTKINVPNFDPGNFGQIVAMGIGNLATNRRVLSLFDNRVVAHQPTIAIFSPDENNLIGFSWDGSNTIGFVKNTTGIVGLLDQVVQQSSGVNLVTFDTSANAYFGNGITNAAPASYVLQATGGSGSDIAGANLDLAGGKGTGAGIPGFIGIRYPLIGASGSTLQSLSTARLPVNTNMYTALTGADINNTTAQLSIFNTASAGSTLTIEGGSTRAGTLYRIKARGTIATVGTPTLRFRVSLGGGNIIDTGTATLVTAAGDFLLDIDISVPAIGATGTTVTALMFSYSTATGTTAMNFVVADNPGTTINFTISQTLDVTAQWSAVANRITFTIIAIDRLR